MGVIEKYAELLPVTDKTPWITLGEGSTPLVHLDRISREMDIDLWGKLEGCNPSGSFKDRGMVMAVAKALESGAQALVCASTGNTSASAEAYAAAAQIPCYVLLPAGKVALGKLAQALMYGAKVIAVKGNFDRALEMAREAAEEKGFAIVNSVNPYRLWGQRSGAWEVCDVLGSAPDWHAVPVGSGAQFFHGGETEGRSGAAHAEKVRGKVQRNGRNRTGRTREQERKRLSHGTCKRVDQPGFLRHIH